MVPALEGSRWVRFFGSRRTLFTLIQIRAKSNGWDVEILSDQLVIRGYSSHEAWSPGPLLVQAASGSQPASLPPSVRRQLDAIVRFRWFTFFVRPRLINEPRQPEPQRSLVTQICTLTRLNVQFAVDCLENNRWNVDQALANFEQVKVRV